MTRYEAITDALPKGYRAREFRDSDREPMVAERNDQVHELQRGTAAEWREWEKIDPPKDLFRVVVETPDGAPVATADIGPGGFPRPDGAQFGSVALQNGNTERIRCTATYQPSEGGRQLRQTLNCDSDNYHFQLSSNLVNAGNTISGNWTENSRHVGGTVSGTPDVPALSEEAELVRALARHQQRGGSAV